jgi:hypothetical protein
MSDAGLIGVDQRIGQLCKDHETLLSYAPAGETDQGVYFVTLRAWDHPTADDAGILSIRYAYLTRGKGGDGWVKDQGASGINMRVEGDPAPFLQGLAQLCAASIPRLGGGKEPATADLRGE